MCSKIFLNLRNCVHQYHFLNKNHKFNIPPTVWHFKHLRLKFSQIQMDKHDQHHINEIIQFTEDDLILHQDFYSIFEKWNDMSVKKVSAVLETDETLCVRVTNQFKENEGELTKLQTCLSNINNDCDKLKQMNLEIENKESNLKTEVESVEAQITELMEAKEKLANDKELDMLKKMCKASKLLTGTIFHHQGTHISGLISTPDDTQNFNFDGEQLKSEEICKELWQMVAIELGIDK